MLTYLLPSVRPNQCPPWLICAPSSAQRRAAPVNSPLIPNHPVLGDNTSAIKVDNQFAEGLQFKVRLKIERTGAQHDSEHAGRRVWEELSSKDYIMPASAHPFTALYRMNSSGVGV